MTVEPDRMKPGAAARLVFLDALAPLPLVDPTEAARFLNVKRHTLACYRNLGGGPPYYKFGRWIRYAWADLLHWTRHVDGGPTPALDPEEGAAPGVLRLVDAATAARFLTLTRFCLASYRAQGGGPRFCRFGRRIHYPAAELADWAAARRRSGAQRDQSTVVFLKGITP